MKMKNKWMSQLLVGLFLVFGFTSVFAQDSVTIVTDIFTVVYSEDYDLVHPLGNPLDILV